MMRIPMNQSGLASQLPRRWEKDDKKSRFTVHQPEGVRSCGVLSSPLVRVMGARPLQSHHLDGVGVG